MQSLQRGDRRRLRQVARMCRRRKPPEKVGDVETLRSFGLRNNSADIYAGKII